MNTTSRLTNARGLQIHARYWGVKSSPRALAFISHGFSEHCEIYHHVSESLTSIGVFVFSHDHVGHGRSEGKRATIDSVDEYVDDLFFHCDMMRARYPKLPLFIIAHSMGGMIALRAALMNPKAFKGIVFIGPLIIPGPSIGPLDFRVTSFRAPLPKFFLGILDSLNPEMVLGDVNRSTVSRDKEVQESMSKDELRWHGGCKVRLLLAFVSCLEDNYNLIYELKVPFLTLHSGSDGLCNVLGSRLLIEKAIVEDKALIEYAGAGHQLFMDIPETRNHSIATTVQWIHERI